MRKLPRGPSTPASAVAGELAVRASAYDHVPPGRDQRAASR
jgi:hypothetical protein